jgi:hypothetical protein
MNIRVSASQLEFLLMTLMIGLTPTILFTCLLEVLFTLGPTEDQVIGTLREDLTGQFVTKLG